MRPLPLLTLVLAATWDAWRWLAVRLWASPEEGLGLALLLLLLAAIAGRAGRRPDLETPIACWPVAGVLLVYAASFWGTPAIVRAALAAGLTTAILYRALLGKTPPLAFWALAGLAMPILPSLQFVLGYPLRLVSAVLTVALLAAQGLVVERQGTFLSWRGDLVQFDAPCSGVTMLWASLVLAFAMALVLETRLLMTVAAAAAALLLTIAANALRAASLVHLEHLFALGPGDALHEAVGLAAFLIPATALLVALPRLAEGTRRA